MSGVLRGVAPSPQQSGMRAATPAAAGCAAPPPATPGARAARLHNWHARVATAAATPTAVAPLRTVLGPAPTARQQQRQQRHAATAAAAATPSTTAAAAPSTAAAVATQPPPLVDYLDFELLWLRGRSKYALSRNATLWALEDARAGLVPCDAAAMCARIEAFLELGRRLPGVDPRPLLNRHRLALRHDPRELVAPARQLLRMLPAYPPTPLLHTALSELPRRPPEALALAISSLAPTVRSALGGSLTGPLLSQLLAACDADSATNAGAFFGAAAAAPWVGDRLRQLAELLGPELAYSALTSAPELIRLEPSEVAVRITALADLLGRPPVEMALMAGRQPSLLLTPPEHVAVAGEALVEGFGSWLGWRRHRALHFLAWNPAVLAAAAAVPGDGTGSALAAAEQSNSSSSGGPSGRGGSNTGNVPAGVRLMEEYWQEVAALAATRPKWRAAVSLRRYPTVAAILCGNAGSGSDPESPGSGDNDDATDGFGADSSSSGFGDGAQGLEDGAAIDEAAAAAVAAGGAGASRFAAWRDSQEQRLQRLRYCADSGDLPRLGLRRVLLMHPVAFLSRCPGYRVWRLREASNGDGAAEDGLSGANALPRWWNEPQLEVLGELGPYDRL